MSAERTKIGVIGLGNVLMSDDAFGPYTIETLRAQYVFPESVSVQDLGTPGLELVTYVADYDFLIVLDTVLSDGKPGALRTYRKAQLLAQAIEPRISPHEPALREALLTADFVGRGPREVVLIGVIPEKITTGCALSPSLRDAIPLAIAQVIQELKVLGVEPIKRAGVPRTQVWWEHNLLDNSQRREATKVGTPAPREEQAYGSELTEDPNGSTDGVQSGLTTRFRSGLHDGCGGGRPDG